MFDHESYTYTYLLAQQPGGGALLIDPVIGNVPRYLQLIAELGLSLEIAIDTHIHADHVTGLGLLHEQTNCTTVMSEHARSECVSHKARDGQRLDLDGLRLEVMYTPGHTDDSCCFRLSDRVFTGDTLLIRGSGRTDFQNGDPGAQYDSLFNRLLKLPQETLVYPAHDYNGMTVSTIGEELRHNPRLQVRSREAYVDMMNSLELPDPKLMDIAVPANRACGRLTPV